jgi:uncharacterized small protein (DUF1192 family)
MSNDNSLSLPELNNRIAILQNNIRQLVQQAAGSVGARDEERISDRIAQQNEELEKLTRERDALLIGRYDVVASRTLRHPRSAQRPEVPKIPTHVGPRKDR